MLSQPLRLARKSLGVIPHRLSHRITLSFANRVLVQLTLCDPKVRIQNLTHFSI